MRFQLIKNLPSMLMLGLVLSTAAIAPPDAYAQDDKKDEKLRLHLSMLPRARFLQRQSMPSTRTTTRPRLQL
jgi:hypothetical protein